MAEATVKFDKGVTTEDALVVCCFPSVGMVSSVVAHFLIDHLDLEFIGGVSHSQLPALCLIQDGAPYPPIRAYAGAPICKVDDCQSVILIMSELVVPEPLVHDIVTALFDWSKESGTRKGMKGGLNGQEPVVEYEDTEDIDVVGIGTTEDMRKMLEDMQILPLEQGVIKGMTGVMLGEGRRRGLDIMSLMVEADPRYPDARAAAIMIEHLNTLLPTIDLDHEPLVIEAERIEEQIRSMIEGAEQSTVPASSSMLYG